MRAELRPLVRVCSRLEDHQAPFTKGHNGLRVRRLESVLFKIYPVDRGHSIDFGLVNQALNDIASGT